MGEIISSASAIEKLTIVGVMALGLVVIASAYWWSVRAHTATLKEYVSHEQNAADNAREKAATAIKSIDEVKDAVVANAGKLDTIHAIMVSRSRGE